MTGNISHFISLETDIDFWLISLHKPSPHQWLFFFPASLPPFLFPFLSLCCALFYLFEIEFHCAAKAGLVVSGLYL